MTAPQELPKLIAKTFRDECIVCDMPMDGYGYCHGDDMHCLGTKSVPDSWTAESVNDYKRSIAQRLKDIIQQSISDKKYYAEGYLQGDLEKLKEELER